MHESVIIRVIRGKIFLCVLCGAPPKKKCRFINGKLQKRLVTI